MLSCPVRKKYEEGELWSSHMSSHLRFTLKSPEPYAQNAAQKMLGIKHHKLPASLLERI